MKYVLATALALVFSNLHAQQGAGVSVGPGYVFPSANLSLTYDDNFTSVRRNKQDAFVYTVSPQLLYEQTDSRLRFAADWRLNAGFYKGSPRDNYADNFLSSIVEYRPTNRFSGALKADYKNSHDPRGTGRAEGLLVDVVTQDYDEWHSYGVEGDVGYGARGAIARVNGKLGYVARQYDNNRISTRIRDRDTTYGSARLLFRIAPDTNLTLGGRLTQHSYDVAPTGRPKLDSKVYRVLAGVNWEATAKTSGAIEFGYAKKDFDERRDNDRMVWEAGITWKPRSYSVVDIASSREYRETNGAGNLIQEDNLINVSWTHAWQQRIRTTVNFNYTENTFNPDPRKDKLIRAGVRVNYGVRRWLTVSGGYTYSKRDSSTNAFDYDRNIISLTVALSL